MVDAISRTALHCQIGRIWINWMDLKEDDEADEEKVDDERRQRLDVDTLALYYMIKELRSFRRDDDSQIMTKLMRVDANGDRLWTPREWTPTGYTARSLKKATAFITWNVLLPSLIDKFGSRKPDEARNSDDEDEDGDIIPELVEPFSS